MVEENRDAGTLKRVNWVSVRSSSSRSSGSSSSDTRFMRIGPYILWGRSSPFTLASEESLVKARRFTNLEELAEARVTLSDVGPAGAAILHFGEAHGVNAPGLSSPPL